MAALRTSVDATVNQDCIYSAAEDWYLSEFEVHRPFNKAWGCKFLSDNLGSSFMFLKAKGLAKG